MCAAGGAGRSVGAVGRCSHQGSRGLLRPGCSRPAPWSVRGFGQGSGLQAALEKDNHCDGHPWGQGPMAAPPPPKAELHRPLASRRHSHPEHTRIHTLYFKAYPLLAPGKLRKCRQASPGRVFYSPRSHHLAHAPLAKAVCCPHIKQLLTQVTVQTSGRHTKNGVSRLSQPCVLHLPQC